MQQFGRSEPLCHFAQICPINFWKQKMWWCNFTIGNDNFATLLMWVVYLGNAIIMCMKWEKEALRG